MDEVPAEPKVEREQIFSTLQSLYEQLDGELAASPSSENSCGQCRECCTAQGLSAHNVTNLELEFIGQRVGPEKIQEFKRFTARDGEIALCPYFDEERWGCGIYAHRPFSCRIFGHMRTAETSLPEVCVFKGQEKIFAHDRYYSEVPLAVELKELTRKFWPYRVLFVDETTPGLVSDGITPLPGDALEQALALQAQGLLPEALELLANSDIEDTPYSLYCASLILEGLGIHKEACRALEQGLVEAPNCAPLHFRLACNLFALGDFEAGAQACRKTLTLKSDHSQAMALLGGYLLQKGSKDEARTLLSQALLFEPDNQSVARLLESAS